MNDEQVQVLNFRARLVTRNPDDARRKFVVSYYLYDRTMQIFEEQVQNSGFRHGKFLQKQRIINPSTHQFFAPSDFFVGAKIKAAGWTFELLAASQLATGLMEANPDEFPESDLGRVSAKLKQAAGTTGADLRKMLQDAAGQTEDGCLSAEEAQAIFEKFAPLITKQAALTISRGFERGGTFAVDELLTLLKL
jgi:hypothetical protein